MIYIVIEDKFFCKTFLSFSSSETPLFPFPFETSVLILTYFCLSERSWSLTNRGIFSSA